MKRAVYTRYEENAKEYFSDTNTVAAWWNPEDGDSLLATHFKKQLHYVIKQFDWKGKKVLDVGTGRGRFAISLALKGADVCGMDISREMIQLAEDESRNAGVKIEFHQGDAENLPYADQSFDIVTCMETIMHLPDPGKAIYELARVAKPDAKVVVSMNNTLSVTNLVLSAQIHAHLYRILKKRHKIHWTYTTRQFRRFFDKTDLRIEKSYGIGIIQPEAEIFIAPGISLPLFPESFGKWFLKDVEERFKLGEGYLQNVMKAVIFIARKTPDQKRF